MMNNATPDRLKDLPRLPTDQEGPIFREPWEAQAFALAVKLSESGAFTWPEWVDVFAAEIHRAQDAGDPDLGDTYYTHWLNALERICTEKGLSDPDQMISRKDRWRRAYLATPHGSPVDLSAVPEEA